MIDRQFGTTDVLVVLPVSAINPRYIDHFGPAADRRGLNALAGGASAARPSR